MGNFFHLWPVLLFLAFMLGVSFWVQRASRGDRQQNFAKDYLSAAAVWAVLSWL